jgi:hypothetical protein
LAVCNQLAITLQTSDHIQSVTSTFQTFCIRIVPEAIALRGPHRRKAQCGGEFWEDQQNTRLTVIAVGLIKLSLIRDPGSLLIEDGEVCPPIR